MLARGRPAFGVLLPAGALVPEGDGFEVAALFADEVGVAAEVGFEPDVDELDAAAPAPVPGRTW